MQRLIHRGLAALLFTGMLCGCAQTTLSGSWRNPEYLQAVRKVYIVGVSRQETVRRLFEDEFGRELQMYGVQAVSSYRDLDDVEDAGHDLIRARAGSDGADALLITRILGTRIEEVVHPGRIYGYDYGPWGYYPRAYYHFWDYYDLRYDMLYEPPTVSRFRVVTLESNLYDVANGELIWSAQLETVMDDNLEQMIRGFIEVVTGDLLKQGVI